MRWILLIAVFLAGLVLGGGAMLLAWSKPERFPSQAMLGKLPPEVQARILMARVASRFTHESDRPRQLEQFVTFYGVPRASAQPLCEVESYTLHPRIVGEQGLVDPTGIDEDVSVTTLYAILDHPDPPEGSYHSPNTGCRGFRDFGALFQSEGKDPFAAPRAAKIMLAAKRAAAKGKPTFKIACADRLDLKVAKNCDGLAMLRDVDLRAIWRIEGVKEQERADGDLRTDRVVVRLRRQGEHHPLIAIYTLHTLQRAEHDIADGELQSVEIEVDAY